MGTQALMLVPSPRRLQRICTRCRGPSGDEHICTDLVRHPGMESFFRALAALADDATSLGIDARLASWASSPSTDVTALADLVETGADEAFIMSAWWVAMLWTNLPRAEQQVANEILLHAGYPQLEVA